MPLGYRRALNCKVENSVLVQRYEFAALTIFYVDMNKDCFSLIPRLYNYLHSVTKIFTWTVQDQARKWPACFVPITGKLILLCSLWMVRKKIKEKYCSKPFKLPIYMNQIILFLSPLSLSLSFLHFMCLFFSFVFNVNHWIYI